MWPKTQKQSHLLEIAEEISEAICETSVVHDRDGTFPYDHFTLMKEKGYISATVPEEYGGRGHGLTDIALAQHQIAKGDGSTALAMGMHHVSVGTEATANSWPSDIRDYVFKESLREGAMVNSLASEPDLGSPRGGGRPATTLVPGSTKGDWVLNGRKTWSTLSPALTFAITFAAVEDGSNDTARIIVRMNTPGVTIEETWNSMSMRSTGSHDVVFSDVILHEEDFISRSNPTSGFSEKKGGDVWFPLLNSAVSLGVASAARDYAVNFAKNRKPTGAPNPISHIPNIREQAAKMEMKLVQAKRGLFSCTEDWEQFPEERDDFGDLIAMTKLHSVQTAIDITDMAMRIVGAVALEKTRPIERYFRDVRSALNNPPLEARALEQIASTVFDSD